MQHNKFSSRLRFEMLDGPEWAKKGKVKEKENVDIIKRINDRRDQPHHECREKLISLDFSS